VLVAHPNSFAVLAYVPAGSVRYASAAASATSGSKVRYG
jgi:hypothetical protein